MDMATYQENMAGLLKDVMLIKATGWEETVQKALIPKFSCFPSLYGLPKVHKEMCLRLPIVNIFAWKEIQHFFK